MRTIRRSVLVAALIAGSFSMVPGHAAGMDPCSAQMKAHPTNGLLPLSGIFPDATIRVGFCDGAPATNDAKDWDLRGAHGQSMDAVVVSVQSCRNADCVRLSVQGSEWSKVRSVCYTPANDCVAVVAS